MLGRGMLDGEQVVGDHGRESRRGTWPCNPTHMYRLEELAGVIHGTKAMGSFHSTWTWALIGKWTQWLSRLETACSCMVLTQKCKSAFVELPEEEETAFQVSRFTFHHYKYDFHCHGCSPSQIPLGQSRWSLISWFCGMVLMDWTMVHFCKCFMSANFSQLLFTSSAPPFSYNVL